MRESASHDAAPLLMLNDRLCADALLLCRRYLLICAAICLISQIEHDMEPPLRGNQDWARRLRLLIPPGFRSPFLLDRTVYPPLSTMDFVREKSH